MSDVERIIEELRPIAEKLGEGAVEVYRLAVRQAFAHGFANLIAALLCIAICVTAVVLGLKFYRKFDELYDRKQRSYDREGAGFAFVAGLCGFAAIISAVVGMTFLFQAILILVNPKWAAIQEILKSLP
jgi:hypothetical protein